MALPSGTATVLQDTGGQGESEAGTINYAGQSVGSSIIAKGDDAIVRRVICVTASVLIEKSI
jgi:hypothetical protein